MSERVKSGPVLNRRLFVQSLGATPLIGLSSSLPTFAAAAERRNGDLAGSWRVALDPDDAGIAKNWHRSPLAEQLPLPGSLETQRRGNPVGVDTPWTGDINDKSFFTAPEYARYRAKGAVKVPFCLQPETWYRGNAWFQREIEIPASWKGRRVELFLERPHWATRLWLDGREVGGTDALHVPHRYNLGLLAPGTHLLSLRVDNRMVVEIGHNGHGVTDHTQGNWNGIAGTIELRATEPVWVDSVALYPDLEARTLRFVGRIGNVSGRAGGGVAELSAAGVSRKVSLTWEVAGGAFDETISFGAADKAALAPWDEFTPTLHAASVRLDNGAEWRDRFGWRDFKATPKGFELNGRPMMFRGALECAIFPAAGHPPVDIESWRKIMRQTRAYGLNHLRFHSYCPPEAAFVAADEAGIYVEVEAVWANQSAAIGQGLAVDKWIYEETDRILEAHGNHPSFLLATHGNEPGGGKESDGEARRDAFLGKYVRHYIAKDPRRLWTAGAGWPEIADSQFHVTPTPRVQNWGEELNSRINAKPPETVTDYGDFVGKRDVPVISHEIGQWCVYPNLEEAKKYTGYLKPKNFEIFADRLSDNGLRDLAEPFLHASGRLQTLCYKEDIESALRTHGMGGFQLLGLQDFPGQGTALVGVVDPFWDEKPYITPAEYRRFCNHIVPLARLPRRVVKSGEALPFTVDIANFGDKPLEGATIAWSIRATSGAQLAKGKFGPQAVPLGNAPLGLAANAVLASAKAVAAKLVVSVMVDGRAIAENDWDLWVYPKTPSPSVRAIYETTTFDRAGTDHLAKGGTVLLGLPRERVANHAERPVKLGFSSIFWNTLWTQHQAPTTLGILCDPGHPALGDFPTETHSNWQWWYLLHRAGALRLDVLPSEVKPIVRVIDDWFTARPLGLVVELAVGRGRLVVCGCPLQGPGTDDPVTQQLRASLRAYMASPAFKPMAQATPEQVKALIAT
ncbi:sugar-binding domain-containing protein [Sphingopyxis sp. NJF-3]